MVDEMFLLTCFMNYLYVFSVIHRQVHVLLFGILIDLKYPFLVLPKQEIHPQIL